MSSLDGKKLLLGVTGGISIYKSFDVIRNLTDMGAQIQVAMTRSAQQFATPLVFETLSDQLVLKDMFPGNEMVATRHIDIPRKSDRILICPATANFIGKVANGIADDLLTTMVMVKGLQHTIFCPAMNSDMWANPVVENNVNTLRKNNAVIIEPESGQLACHTEGIGRLASIERIVSRTKIELLRTDLFAGKHFIITAGRTEEALDPVRFITNASSGKMGFALAEAALSRGADVTLVTGPNSLIPPDEATVVRVRNAKEMDTAVNDSYSKTDVVIMSAAVSDYKPKQYHSQKIKKGEDHITLELEKTTDILASLGKQKKNRILVGFAVETDNMIANASQKMREKNLDLVVVNNPSVNGAAFQADTNVVTILNRKGEEKSLPLLTKFEVGLYIMDEIAVLLGLKAPLFKPGIYV